VELAVSAAAGKPMLRVRLSRSGGLGEAPPGSGVIGERYLSEVAGHAGARGNGMRPRLRMGRSFMRRMTSAIASLHSASEKNVSPRSRPRM
jgi:hypothetical protein